MKSRKDKYMNRSVPWGTTSTITLLVIGFSFLGYGGYEVYTASANTQNLMQQSKTVKDVYGQGAKGRQEHQNRVMFDKLYDKYVKADGSTLIHLDKGIPASVSKNLTTLSSKTGAYYSDAYADKAKMFALLSSTQNDYIQLWSKGQVGKTFGKNVRPSTVYLFNANHYNDLQTMLAINADSQYPIWMTSQMQRMGGSAISVENLIQSITKYFTFPSATNSWRVTHDFTTSVQSNLFASYNQIGYKWKILSFLPDLLDASDAAGLKNELMQRKVDEANSKIASIKAASIASSEAIASSKAAESSSKAASESASKASSDEESRRQSYEKEKESAAESSKDASTSSSTSTSSSSSEAPQMPNYVGQSVDTALAWAIQRNIQVAVQAITDTSGTHSDREILSQSKRGDVYYISYFSKSN